MTGLIDIHSHFIPDWRTNDFAARLRAEHPDRFGVFASLPIPAVDASIAEAVRALGEVGADGIAVKTNTHGVPRGCLARAALERSRRARSSTWRSRVSGVRVNASTETLAPAPLVAQQIATFDEGWGDLTELGWRELTTRNALALLHGTEIR